MKILTIVGARPQFVKAAVVSRAFRELSGGKYGAIEEKIVHTGQHFDTQMSDVFFDEMDIPRPSHQLAFGGLTHGAMTGRMVEGIERIILDEKPDWVLVYGDTNSTLAGTLAAVKLHVPVAHVEAGLRSYNRQMPEEINRILTDHASSLLFPPTQCARETLLSEGIPDRLIMVSGDVMYDAAMFYGGLSDQRSNIVQHLGLSGTPFILSTIHRAENTDNPEKLTAIVAGLAELSSHLPVVLPLHPRTRNVVEKMDDISSLDSLHIIAPVGYLDMVALEKHADLIVTDSGGVQKEAYFFATPCLTLRTETEWTELVELGVNKVVEPSSKNAIVAAANAMINTNYFDFSKKPYGNGDAAMKIAHHILG